MNYFTLIAASLLFVFGVAVAHASESAPTAPAPVNISTELALKAGERRTAQVGDIIHEDRRSLTTQVLTVVNEVRDVCDSGWCHNFAAGAELVYVGYGPRMYCSREKTGQRDTLFSDYPSFSCIHRDNETGAPSKIFGLKEFNESLRINAVPLPRSIRVEVTDTPLDAYPEWLSSRGSTYIDGVFRVRFAGVADGRVMLDLEHEPEIDGSQAGLVRRITLPLDSDRDLPLPFPQPDTDYENLVEKRVHLAAASYSGVTLKVHGSTSTSLDYETVFDTKLLQIYSHGHWKIQNDGRAVESRNTYR